MRIPSWDLYVSDSAPFVETQHLRTLRVTAQDAGNCDACTRGYHAGEEIGIDHDARVLHWQCHLRENNHGGRLLDWRRRKNY